MARLVRDTAAENDRDERYRRAFEAFRRLPAKERKRQEWMGLAPEEETTPIYRHISRNLGHVVGTSLLGFSDVRKAAVEVRQDLNAMRLADILAEDQHYDLIEEISELRDGHNGIVRALAKIFRLRDELAEAMPPNRFEGNVASFEGEPSPKARMLLIRLTTLTDNVLRNINELKEQARKAAPDFHQKLKASLKVEKFPKITLPALAAEAIEDEEKADPGSSPG